MKITNSDIIRNGERELIDAITADLDWSAIEAIFKERHKLAIQDDVEYRQGDIVVHDGQVAYQLDFDVRVTLSVLFDRDGNYLSVSTTAETSGEPEEAAGPEDEAPGPEAPAAPEETGEAEGADEAEAAEAEAEIEAGTGEEEDEAEEMEAEADEGPETGDREDAMPPIDDMENLVLAGAGEEDAEDGDVEPLTPDPEREPDENISRMAADLADMINEINE